MATGLDPKLKGRRNNYGGNDFIRNYSRRGKAEI